MWYNCRRKLLFWQGERRLRSFGRENVLDKFYLNPNGSASECELSTRRIFNGSERRYLSLEARSMAYALLGSPSIPPDLTESALEQAVALGSLSGEEVDAQTFEALFHAITLNPSFKIPVWVISANAPSGAWVC
jgi:hypothetical protein